MAVPVEEVIVGFQHRIGKVCPTKGSKTPQSKVWRGGFTPMSAVRGES
jgi:hypothetical protein